jgi:hypothetical protein
VQIFDASADIMEKAFEEGAKIRREAEARKAAVAARGRSSGAGSLGRTASGGRGSSARSGGARSGGGSAASKLPWTLTAMPVPVMLPPANSGALALASPAASGRASPVAGSDALTPPGGATGAAVQPAAGADDGSFAGDLPPAKWQKTYKRSQKTAANPQLPRVPLLQSGLGMLPTLLPKAAHRAKAEEQQPKSAPQVHLRVGPNTHCYREFYRWMCSHPIAA